MSKKSKAEVIEEVQDLIQDVQSLISEISAQDPQGKVVVVPASVIEALTVTHDSSNRVGVTSVVEQIREMAQKQCPEMFQGFRVP